MIKLIIDIGNTLVKIARFNQNEMIEIQVFDTSGELEWADCLRRQTLIDAVIVCSVAGRTNQVADYLPAKAKIIYFSHEINLPIKNKYQSPETLGPDRLALAVGASVLFPEKNVLVVSAGTCITYEFINQNAEYEGGLITPGLQMRCKAMNYYTKKLPLLDFREIIDQKFLKPDYGKNTEDAMSYGVFWGILAEMQMWIAFFQQRTQQRLKVILTGGDAKYFEKSINFKTFAYPNLLLLGLNKILDENLNHK